MNKKPIYPFVGIVGQEKMKLALILNIITPSLSGVLIRGEKGTAKSTAVRALAEILPRIDVIGTPAFQLDPQQEYEEYKLIAKALGLEPAKRKDLSVKHQKIQVVELPVGATEDRVAGTLDLEHALQKGEKRVEPGLLAQAHRGILYVDEVNLLDDHVVDILLDVSAMGTNTIEREGISFSHPSRFTLVGTMNPEEGELRPQLLDRFGLCVNIRGIETIEERVAIMEQRIDFDKDPHDFCIGLQQQSKQLTDKIIRARELYPDVTAASQLLHEIARTCLEVGVDGHRGDIVILKTAKTLAAWHGRCEVLLSDIHEASEFALPHRVRRKPLMDIPDSIEHLRPDNTPKYQEQQ